MCQCLSRRKLLQVGVAGLGASIVSPVFGHAQTDEGFICSTILPKPGAALDQQAADGSALLETDEAPIKTSDLTEQGVAAANLRWRPSDGRPAPNGHVRLGVAFVDSPGATWEAQVIERSLRWIDPTDELGAKLAKRISFEFGVPLKDAQIRVVKGGTTNATNGATRSRMNCSLVGRDALTYSLDDAGNQTTRKNGQASMFITNIESVGHEFGHALCLLHEQSYDALPIKIDQQKAIDYYRQPPNNWKAEVTIANVLTPAKRSQRCLGDNVFNPASVMLYSIPREITEDGTSLYAGTSIHPRDRKCVNSIYGA